MTEFICSNENCTISQTGICLLNNQPGECDFCQVADEIISDEALLGEPLLSSPTEAPRFSPSAALGLDDVRSMLGKRYGHVVGILGAPDSGKTALLVSLYLLMAHGRLSQFSFAGSRSLLTFEDIARGARNWNEGSPPDQMTAHTELGDSRAAGLLHLRLKRQSTSSCLDLFIPDLPGEWSTNLIDENEHERLSFLLGSEAIWLTVDGASLLSTATRNNSIHRMKLLIDRVIAFYNGTPPRLFLVVTRCDVGRPSEAVIDRIMSRAVQHGVNLQVMHVASFSNDPNIPAGTGISELISATIVTEPRASEFWPCAEASGPRQILRLPVENGYE
ncbi:TRAFAC clade GTPase domain-containing protein [Pseudomonas fulva]|uniref:TRAFAC clade GTPase domain-containing protein n=1 Tax=Pseudomonas fulva TaxID=47880 RepID=UPI000AF1829E